MIYLSSIAKWHDLQKGRAPDKSFKLKVYMINACPGPGINISWFYFQSYNRFTV